MAKGHDVSMDKLNPDRVGVLNGAAACNMPSMGICVVQQCATVDSRRRCRRTRAVDAPDYRVLVCGVPLPVQPVGARIEIVRIVVALKAAQCYFAAGNHRHPTQQHRKRQAVARRLARFGSCAVLFPTVIVVLATFGRAEGLHLAAVLGVEGENEARRTELLGGRPKPEEIFASETAPGLWQI